MLYGYLDKGVYQQLREMETKRGVHRSNAKSCLYHKVENIPLVGTSVARPAVQEGLSLRVSLQLGFLVSHFISEHCSNVVCGQ